MNRRCSKCGNEMRVKALSGITAASGDVVVRFTTLTVLACAVDAHGYEPLDPDFGALMTEQIFFSGSIPVSRLGAFSMKCYKCAEKLPKDQVARGKVGGELRWEDRKDGVLGGGADQCVGVMEFDGPVVRCAECGATQILATKKVGNDVSNAFAEVLRNASIV